MKEPPTTLPQLWQTSLLKEDKQLPLSRCQYQSTALPPTQKLKASLRNCRPQKNSNILSTSQIPELKLKRFLLSPIFDAKQKCCHTIKVTKPSIAKKNMGI